MECWTQLLSSYHPGKIHKSPEIPTNPKICLNLMCFFVVKVGKLDSPKGSCSIGCELFVLVLSGDRRMSKRTGKDHLFWWQIQPRWHEHLDFYFVFSNVRFTLPKTNGFAFGRSPGPKRETHLFTNQPQGFRCKLLVSGSGSWWNLISCLSHCYHHVPSPAMRQWPGGWIRCLCAGGLSGVVFPIELDGGYVETMPNYEKYHLSYCSIELGCYQVPILNLPSIELCFDRFWGPFTLTMPSRDALLHWNMLCNFCGFPWYKGSSIWSTASWFNMILPTRNSWSTQDMIEKDIRII